MIVSATPRGRTGTAFRLREPESRASANSARVAETESRHSCTSEGVSYTGGRLRNPPEVSVSLEVFAPSQQNLNLAHKGICRGVCTALVQDDPDSSRVTGGNPPCP